MLRYITKRLDLSLAIVWKRFIDDILVFIRSRDKPVLDSFVDRVQSHFKDYGLDITVKSLNPAHPEHDKRGILINSIEFLDVNHSFDSADHMQTGLFVKPKAQNDGITGQTSKPFRTRISQHRSKWTTGAETYRDDTALLDHYREFHFEVYQNWCNNNTVQVGFDQAFKLYFVDKVGDNLSKQEDFWQKRLSSRINRCNIITPAIIY